MIFLGSSPGNGSQRSNCAAAIYFSTRWDFFGSTAYCIVEYTLIKYKLPRTMQERGKRKDRKRSTNVILSSEYLNVILLMHLINIGSAKLGINVAIHTTSNKRRQIIMVSCMFLFITWSLHVCVRYNLSCLYLEPFGACTCVSFGVWMLAE